MPRKAEKIAGQLFVSSAPGKVDVLPGYTGPRTEADLKQPLPPRSWAPRRAGRGTPRLRRVEVAGVSLTQIDARAYTEDQSWSGLRFLFKVDNLAVEQGETKFNLFTTHLGREVNGVANWTEIGIVRAVQDPRYRLFTFDPHQNPQWSFFGETRPGEVFEFAIRLNEADTGPYRYETYCSGLRVRQGTLPRLDCQVDLSHESWTESLSLTDGDVVYAVEGWVNYPPQAARWFDSTLKIGYYTTKPTEKSAILGAPRARRFFAST